jgi:Lon protease-like protein
MENSVHTLPLLPLSEVVFFPKTLLPLFVYEPRYQLMLAHCLAGDRRLAIALLRDGYGPDAYWNGPVFRVVCIGKVIDDEKLADGKYNVLIEGTERACIVREIQQQPFRVAQVESLQDFIGEKKKGQLNEAVKQLMWLCNHLGALFPQHHDTLKSVFASHLHPGIIVDTIAYTFVEGQYERQCILSELNIVRRIRLVQVQLKHLIRRYSKEPYPDFL